MILIIHENFKKKKKKQEKTRKKKEEKQELAKGKLNFILFKIRLIEFMQKQKRMRIRKKQISELCFCSITAQELINYPREGRRIRGWPCFRIDQ